MAGFELGAPQIATSQATCVGAADLLLAARPQRRTAMLYNHVGGSDAYIGDSTVTTSTGLFVAQGTAVSIDTTAEIYGATASLTATFSIMETYQ